jgi:DNA-binding beta-propeller fold protein YncE
MFFFSWLRNRKSNPRGKRATAARPKHTRFRPLLEALEDRCLLSSGSTAISDTLYIGDGNDNTIKRFDASSGAYEGTFVTSGSGGLLGPRGLIFGEGHNLLAVNQNVFTTGIGGEVLRYDGQTGAFINKVVADTDPHNPYDPRGVVRGPHHSLFVGDLGDLGNLDGTGRPGRLAQFDEKTGAWIRDLSPTVPFTTDNGPRGVVIGPDGLLYVAVRNFNPLGGEVMRFNPATGAFLGDFVDSNSTNDLNRPEGLVFGPDGNLYVTSFRSDASDTDKILVFKGTTGAYLGKIDLDQVNQPRAFAQALLFGPGGKLFVPITGSGPDTGKVRRYDVSTGTFDVFIPPSASGGLLGMPWYLTFGDTDPATLAFPSSESLAASQSLAAATSALSQATSALHFAPLVSSLLETVSPAVPAAPVSAAPALSAPATSQSGGVMASASPAQARVADTIFVASHMAVNDDGNWLFAPLSTGSLDAM